MTVWTSKIILSIACFVLGMAGHWITLPRSHQDFVSRPPSIFQAKAPDPVANASMLGASVTLDQIFREPRNERPPLILRYVAQASSEDLQRLHERFLADTSHLSPRSYHAYYLFLRWLESDPTEALTEARSPEQGLLRSLFAVWGEVDLDAALMAMSLQERHEQMSSLLQANATNDPKRFAELFLESYDLAEVFSNPRSYLDAIIAHRPDQLGKLAEIAIRQDQTEQIAKIYLAWASHEPEKALASARAIYDIGNRTEALAAIEAREP